MTATQGYNQKIFFEDLDTPDTYIDMSTYLSDGSIKFDDSVIDVTTFGTDGWTSKIPGLKSASVSVTAFMDATLRTYLFGAFNRATPFGVKHYPNGNATGAAYYAFDGVLTGFGDGGTVSAANGGSSTIESSGEVTIETES